jgi:hypothetical protein
MLCLKHSGLELQFGRFLNFPRQYNSFLAHLAALDALPRMLKVKYRTRRMDA